HHEPEALTLVMLATTAWLQGVLRRPDGPPRLQVLDEAWSLLASERTSRYLQACWKLGRAYGVANVAIVHRLSDLRSQADDGTAASRAALPGPLAYWASQALAIGVFVATGATAWLLWRRVFGHAPGPLGVRHEAGLAGRHDLNHLNVRRSHGDRLTLGRCNGR